MTSESEGPGMKETNGQIRFDISTLLKTSKPRKHQEPLTLKPYMILSYVLLNASNSISNKHQNFGMGLTSYGLVTNNPITQLAKLQSADVKRNFLKNLA